MIESLKGNYMHNAYMHNAHTPQIYKYTEYRSRVKNLLSLISHSSELKSLLLLENSVTYCNE